MTSRVGPKGQVVIPKPIRDRLGIHSGGEVVFVETEDGVRIAPAGDVRELGGRYAGSGLTRLLETERTGDLEREERMRR